MGEAPTSARVLSVWGPVSGPVLGRPFPGPASQGTLGCWEAVARMSENVEFIWPSSPNFSATWVCFRGEELGSPRARLPDCMASSVFSVARNRARSSGLNIELTWFSSRSLRLSCSVVGSRRECVGELESWRLPVVGFCPSWSVRVWGVPWSVSWSWGRSCRSVPEVLPWSVLDPWSCVVRRSGVSCFCGSAGVSRVVFADSSVSVPHRLEVSTVSGSGVSLSLSRLVREVSVGVVLSSVAGRVGLVGREFSVPSED